MHVLFDVNGTITDPSGLGEAWGRPELGAPILRSAIETAMTDTIVGVHRPLAEHLRGALVLEAARSGLDAALVDEAAERATRLRPWPDAREALGLLTAAGLTVAALTNSGAAAGRTTLEHAGLLDAFDLVLGVEAVGVFKPHPRTYAHAVEHLGGRPEDVLLVAAHGWDVAGAAHAGLRTGFVSRTERALSPVVPAPDLTAPDLLGMARAIVGA
jgi:2-haloacid dehalogenase